MTWASNLSLPGLIQLSDVFPHLPAPLRLHWTGLPHALSVFLQRLPSTAAHWIYHTLRKYVFLFLVTFSPDRRKGNVGRFWIVLNPTDIWVNWPHHFPYADRDIRAFVFRVFSLFTPFSICLQWMKCFTTLTGAAGRWPFYLGQTFYFDINYVSLWHFPVSNNCFH